MISGAGVRGEVRLVRIGKTSALVLVGTVTVRDDGTPVLSTTDEGAMQVAWSGAPVQAREMVPLKSMPGVSCRLKEAVWPAVTEAERVPVSANAGAALAKMFRTCGEPGASSVTERVSLRGPEKTGEKVMLDGATGIGGNGGGGARAEGVGEIDGAVAACGNTGDVQRRCAGIGNGDGDGSAGESLNDDGERNRGGNEFQHGAIGGRRDACAVECDELRAACGVVGEGKSGLTRACGERRERFGDRASGVGRDRGADAIAGWALKSAGLLPPRIIEEIVSAALPELVTVTLSGELVAFCESEGKLSVPGAKVMAGAGGGGAVPVPVTGTSCGLPEALSVMESLAIREPDAAGVKMMEMKQECVGGMAVGTPQVSDSANSEAFVQ